MTLQLTNATSPFKTSKLARAVLTGFLAVSLSVVGISSASADDTAKPVFTSGGTGTATENSTATSYTAAATDDNPVTFTLFGGDDLADLLISPEGVLSFLVTPDFEIPGDANQDNIYEVIVHAEDTQGNFETQIVSVTVSNDPADDPVDPIADDFTFTGLTATADGTPKAVTITPKADKSTGAITVKYDGVDTAPTDAGTYAVTFDVAAATGFNAVAGLSAGNLVISEADADPVPSISPLTQVVSGFVGSTIVATNSFVVTHFVGAVTYSVTSGTLPDGLIISSSTGVITGTPTATSTGSVTITATGATSGSATSSVTFAIIAKPVANVSTAIAVVPALNQSNTYAADLPGTVNIPVAITIPAGTTGAVPTAFEIKASASSSDSYTVLTIVAKALSDSATVTTFLVPIAIKLPVSVATDALPAWSSGGAWASIPLIPDGATTLPTGSIDGYYLSGTDRIILTKHLTSFGYRKDQAAVTLSAASASVTAGATVNLTAAGGSGTIAYTYATSTSGVCSVSGVGVVTTTAVGTCSVTATNPSSGDYVSKTSSAVTITVNAAVATVTTTADTSAADKAAADAKAAADKAAADAKAAADKLAAEKAAAEKAAADAKAAAEKLSVEKAAAEKFAQEQAEAAEQAAIILAAAKKAASNSIKISSTSRLTRISLDLADVYYGRIAYVQVVTKTKTGTRTTTLDYFVVDREDGKATISVKKLLKGQKLQVRIGKTLVFNKMI